MGLKVLVVGAGIAGLASSISLTKAGHDVTILEQSHFKKEMGAAITITPNGQKILDRWGFDFEKAGVINAQKVELVDGATLQPFYNDSFSDLKQQFGYGTGHYHRVDLHRTLREQAESLGVKIELGSGVADVENNATVKTHDGRSYSADLVIIADGIHSKLLPKITGKEEPLVDSGRSAIRALIPQDKIRANPTLKPLFGQRVPGFYNPCTFGAESTHLVTYPCRNNEILNAAIVHNTLPGYEKRMDWHSPISHEDALKTIEKFNPACHELFSLASTLEIYALPRREILPNFVNGRLVVIGDAAHAMPPTHAQGASTSFEEAHALELFLHNVKDSEQVPARLELYEHLVKPRMQTVQLLSQALVGMDLPYRKQAEAIWDGQGHGKLYPEDTSYWTAPVREFFYGYDIKSEVDRVAQKAGIEVC